MVDKSLSKFALKKRKKDDIGCEPIEASKEAVFSPMIKEELAKIENIRMFYRPHARNGIFHLKHMPIHLGRNGPVNRKLFSYLDSEPEELNNPKLQFLIQPFLKFISSDKGQKEKETVTEGYTAVVRNSMNLLSDLTSEAPKLTKPDLQCLVQPFAKILSLQEGKRIAKVAQNLDTYQRPSEETSKDVHPVNKSKEKEMVAERYSPGLYNLGNTCYANSTLQILRSIPELRLALMSYNVGAIEVDQESHDLTVATRHVFGLLDESHEAVDPLDFIKALRKSNATFAEMEDGIHRQQDAEECWMHLMNTLSQTLGSQTNELATGPVNKLFEINLVNRVHCAETEEEYTKTEAVKYLHCQISDNVNHLHEGLKNGLKSEVKKLSDSLKMVVVHTESTIIELPRYLTIYFASVDTLNGQSFKNSRKVDYPKELDMQNYCSEELKKNLLAHGKASLITPDDEPSIMNNDKAGSQEIKLTGMYDLIAILTHEGPAPGFGHYRCFVKQHDANWVQFDDANTTICTEEEVLKLYGGGEGRWHISACTKLNDRNLKASAFCLWEGIKVM